MGSDKEKNGREIEWKGNRMEGEYEGVKWVKERKNKGVQFVFKEQRKRQLKGAKERWKHYWESKVKKMLLIK